MSFRVAFSDLSTTLPVKSTRCYTFKQSTICKMIIILRITFNHFQILHIHQIHHTNTFNSTHMVKNVQ